MSIDRSHEQSSSRQQYGLSSSSPNGAVSSAAASVVPSRLAIFAARQPEAAVNSFSGAVAGMASGIVTCPLDVIKTKLQGQGGLGRMRSALNANGGVRPSYNGLIGTAAVIWREDGVKGMYRGLSPMLLGYLPTWAVYMTAYGAARDYYYTKIENKTVAQALASVTAGACSSIVTNPIWVIKTRLMSQSSHAAMADVQTPWHYHGTIDAFRKMYSTEGFGAFYSGLGPALLGLTHVAIQFPLYEYLKKNFTGVEMGRSTEGDGMNHTVGVLVATFLSKVCATSATYPHEVLRTRLQNQQRSRAIARHSARDPPSHPSIPVQEPAPIPRYHGVLSTCRIILREEGWRAFYSGMGTNLVRAVPAAMTTMLTFETMKTHIHALQDEGRRVQDDDV